MSELPGFASFAADQSQPLARTAFLLTGDVARARALVVRSLTDVASRWSSVRWSSPGHSARAAMFATYLKHPHQKTPSPREARDPRDPPNPRDPRDSREPRDPREPRKATATTPLADALAALPPRQRALVVARFHEGATEWQAAQLCRGDVHTTRTETVVALSELRHRLPSLTTSFPSGTAPASELPAVPDGQRPAVPGKEASAQRAIQGGERRQQAAVHNGQVSEEPAQGMDAKANPQTPWPSPTPELAAAPPPHSDPLRGEPTAAPPPHSDPLRGEPTAAPPPLWAPSLAGPAAPPPSQWASPTPELAAAPPPLWDPLRGQPTAAPPPPWAPSLAGPIGPSVWASSELPGLPWSPSGSPTAEDRPRLPWPEGPSRAYEDSWQTALGRGLTLLAAEMPTLDRARDVAAGRTEGVTHGVLGGLTRGVSGDVTGEVFRSVRRRRARRRAFVTSVSLTVAALIITPIAFGVAALVGGVYDATIADPFANQDEGTAHNVPDVLPSVVGDPIRYAYQDLCPPSKLVDELGDQSTDCQQWRVVTTKGREWRIPDVHPAHSTGPRPLFALSADGNRIAYYSYSISDFVVMDRRHSVPEESELTLDMKEPTDDTGLVISPTGRWLAADFGEAARAPKPRLHDFSANRTWTLPERLTILGISDDGTVMATVTSDVTNVRGHASTTELVRMRPGGHVLSRVRFDPALFDNGAVLSPDGRALALSTERAHPAEGDHGLLVTVDPATGKMLTRSEAALPKDTHIFAVRGWASDHEVVVEAVTTDEVGDESYSVHAVDVKSGAAREIVLDEGAGVPNSWLPGTLR